MIPRRRLVRHARHALFALTLVLPLLPTPAAAQALYGSVTGTIADGTGAAVPGASVTIKNEAAVGDTRTTVYTVGQTQTWTLGPTLLLDGSVGANVMQQSMTGPDYGTNFGLDGAACRVAERVQSHAVGQPGDEFHEPELHAHPFARARAAHSAVGRAVYVLAA